MKPKIIKENTPIFTSYTQIIEYYRAKEEKARTEKNILLRSC